MVPSSGYFTGSASWSHSFDALSDKRHVYAIDWPSWGLSCREQNFPSGQGTEICSTVEMGVGEAKGG